MFKCNDFTFETNIIYDAVMKDSFNNKTKYKPKTKYQFVIGSYKYIEDKLNELSEDFRVKVISFSFDKYEKSGRCLISIRG